jgi:hypothetical protein
MTYTRVVRLSSGSLGPISPRYTGAGACANATNGKFRIDGTLPTAYTCAGASWTAPPLDDDVTASISATFLSVGELVGEVRAWNDASMGTIGRCTSGGCALTEPGSGSPYYEFRAPAGSVVWVALYLDEMSELSPTPTAASEIRILGGVIGPKQTGQVYEDWGWCHSASGSPVTCTDQEKERNYRALVRAAIAAQDLRGNVRVRPAPTASLLEHVRDPGVATISDGAVSSLNFSSVSWRTCEGTWSGSTCVDNLPDH